MKGSKPEAATAGWGLFCASTASTRRCDPELRGVRAPPPRRVARGPPAEGDFTGAAGGAACGDLARISLAIEDGRVAAVSFDTEGCGADAGRRPPPRPRWSRAPACSRRPAIGADEVDAALGGLTPAKRHAAGSPPTPFTAPSRLPPRVPEPGSPPAGPERVLVAMSGGVDSAVAALLERERGAEVVAVTVKLWADPETDGAKACCSPEAVLGARGLAHSLGHPALHPRPRGGVPAPGRRRASSPATPRGGPRTRASSATARSGSRRWSALADRLGASALVTGHYARIVDDGDGPLLAPAADAAKDQSYMLAGAAAASCSGGSRFPLADLAKPRGARDRRSPRPRRRPQAGEPGPLLPRRPGQAQASCAATADWTKRDGDRARPLAARTSGATAATTTSPSASAAGSASPPTEPLYVLATDAAANTVTVGTARGDGRPAGSASATRSCTATAPASTGPPPLPLRARRAAIRGGEARRRPPRRARAGALRAVPRRGSGADRGADLRGRDRRPRDDRSPAGGRLMARRRQLSRLDRALEGFARKPIGGWIAVNIANPIDRRLLRYSKGRFGLFLGQQVGLLEHTGARSGAARETPLLYIRDGENFVIVASKAGATKHPAWYHNVNAHPRGRLSRRRARSPLHRP